MSSSYGAQPSSPFYAQQQQQPLHTNHGAPPPQHQHQQQSSYVATSPVSAHSYPPSPPQQAPPRPHTTAPYPGPGFGPPLSAGPTSYYQQFPSQQPQQPQQQQPQPGYRPHQQQPEQAASDYGSPQQPQQQRNYYAPAPAVPAPPAPPVGYPSDIPHLASSHGVSPEVVQKLAADLLNRIQQSNIPPPTVAPVGPPPRLDHPAPPGGTPLPNMGQQPPQPPPMQQQQQPPQMPIPGSFPPYAPALAPQEPPQVPHHQYRQHQQQQQPQGYPPQQQGYFPSQSASASSAPSAPPPVDLKGPPPGPSYPQMQQQQKDASRRETPQRYRSNTASTHHSHTSTPGTSTSSGPAANPTKMEGGNIHYDTWGDLVDQQHGREPMPKEKLVRLFREIANYIIKERTPANSIVITPEKMVDFYAVNAVDGDDRMDWKGYFTNRTHSSLSSIYRVLGCEHFYVPVNREQKPSIPALTPLGFETWMFTQLMTCPSREAARIQKVVALWPIHDSKGGQRFPKSIPRCCFPEKEDSLIYQGWWRVWEEFPPDFEDEEEEQAPLALPAPGDSNGNRYYGPPPLHGPLSGADHAAAAPMARKRAQQKYNPNPQDLNDEELNAFIEDRKGKPPQMERHRKPYASSTGNPGWREELNPRPTLGEDKASSARNGPPPPSRPHTSHGHHPSHNAREFREEPYVKPGPDRDPRDLSDSPEAPLGRSKSTRRGHQRERSEFRRPHRHSQSHHRGGGRRDRSPADEHDPEWSGSSGVSAQTPTSAPDAGVPIPGAAPAPPPLDSHDRRSRAQRKVEEEAARVAREQEELFRGYVPPGRYENPANPYDYEEFAAPPRGRGGERDDRRVAEYAYQDEYDRDRRTQPGGGAGVGRRSSHYGGDRGRPRDRSSYWAP